MLQTILSGKVASEEGEEEHPKVAAATHGRMTKKESTLRDAVNKDYMERRRKNGKRRSMREASWKGDKSKNLLELEFEELKGLMDFGFTFSEAESDEQLLSIVPGLQKLGKRRTSKEEGEGVSATTTEETKGSIGDPAISRPYLLELENGLN